MDWSAPVDIYCERLAPGFWAEPVNAVSNAAFLAAALWGLIEARRAGERNPLVWLLVALAAVIGIGSFLFHTFANRWSGLADVLPIWTFVAVYVFVAMARLGGMRPGMVAGVALAITAVVALVIAMGEGADAPAEAAPSGPDPFNGSLQYLPAVVAMAAFSVVTLIRRHPMRRWVWGASAAFVVSLGFRTLDRDICAAFPLGTHFVWHLMNGAMIGLLLQLLIRTPAALRRQTAATP